MTDRDEVGVDADLGETAVYTFREGELIRYRDDRLFVVDRSPARDVAGDAPSVAAAIRGEGVPSSFPGAVDIDRVLVAGRPDGTRRTVGDAELDRLGRVLRACEWEGADLPKVLVARGTDRGELIDDIERRAARALAADEIDDEVVDYLRDLVDEDVAADTAADLWTDAAERDLHAIAAERGVGLPDATVRGMDVVDGEGNAADRLSSATVVRSDAEGVVFEVGDHRDPEIEVRDGGPLVDLYVTTDVRRLPDRHHDPARVDGFETVDDPDELFESRATTPLVDELERRGEETDWEPAADAGRSFEEVVDLVTSKRTAAARGGEETAEANRDPRGGRE